MIDTKSKFSEIVHNVVYSMIIILSIIFFLIRSCKSNIGIFLDKINSVAAKISFSEINKKREILSCSQNSNIEENSDDSKIAHSDFHEKKSKKKLCKIFEVQLGNSGIKCGNFYVKNKTGKKIDFDKYLSKSPKFKANNNKPVILIYHTHTSERYMTKDDGTFPEDFYARTQDNSKNVVAIGEEIVKTLKKKGINAIHEKTIHDYPSYNGSYSRSAKTIMNCLKENPEIQILIDIHRDSMGENKTGKIKPTFRTKNGKKAAQIMFVSGCGINKSMKFPLWEKNLTLALNLQSVCEKNFPGFTRELIIKNSKYNQQLSTGAILIEVGSDMNTVEESKLSAQMLGESLAAFFKKFSK